MSLLRYWRALLALSVVFVAGIVVGGVGTVRYIQREYRAKLDDSTWAPRTLDWLRTAAALTPEQERQIEPIVHDAIEQMKELRDSSEAQRRGVVKELLTAVAVSLPDEQRAKLVQAAKEAEAKSQRAKRSSAG
ncbi:MAG: hypothetical protein JNL96_02350 [Planctomycetaceae bacterium]|nr:hypothetical protein [Planctomycetaceae bacterium]